MEDFLYSTFLLLLASTMFTVCNTDKVMDRSASGDDAATEQRVLAEIDAAAAGGDGEARMRQVMVRNWLPGDYESAIPLLVELAESGQAGAAEVIAGAYMHGKGVDVDFDQAARWLERASDLGSESAAKDLEYFATHSR